jgi:hypothetical protein
MKASVFGISLREKSKIQPKEKINSYEQDDQIGGIGGSHWH